jgi:predicted RNase H-related nuclease YkuK (DUF458 family)
MLKEWRSLSDHQIIDPKSHLEEWILENSDYKIYVGCDSSNQLKKTTFATVIVLHKGKNGGHVIYSKISEPKIKTKHERLWKEIEFSVFASGLLDSWGFGKPDYIDIDLNPDPKFASNPLLASAVGMVESMGIKARWKSKSPWAISIADSICR